MSPCEVLSCPHKDSRPCHHRAQPRRSRPLGGSRGVLEGGTATGPPGEQFRSADGPGWLPGVEVACWVLWVPGRASESHGSFGKISAHGAQCEDHAQRATAAPTVSL